MISTHPALQSHGCEVGDILVFNGGLQWHDAERIKTINELHGFYGSNTQWFLGPSPPPQTAKRYMANDWLNDLMSLCGN
jgi:hypothetical protein